MSNERMTQNFTGNSRGTFVENTQIWVNIYSSKMKKMKKKNYDNDKVTRATILYEPASRDQGSPWERPRSVRVAHAKINRMVDQTRSPNTM